MTIDNQQYQVQGVPLLDIASEYGTPVYVYDGQKILDQVATLQNAFSSSEVSKA